MGEQVLYRCEDTYVFIMTYFPVNLGVELWSPNQEDAYNTPTSIFNHNICFNASFSQQLIFTP